MLTFLSMPYLVLFVIGTFAQLAVICLLVRHKSFRIYPMFALCLSCQLSSGMAALIAFKSSPTVYMAVYYFGSISSGILMLLAAGEVCAHVFGPRIGIPQWAQKRLALFIGMGVATAVLIHSLWRPLNGGQWGRTFNGLELDLAITAWAVFSILWIFSRSLGISWRPRLQGIVLGFVLYLSIDVAMVFVRARWPREAIGIAGQIGLIAYLLSLAVWGKTFWAAEPVRESATDEMMEEFEAHHRANMEALGKLTTLSN